MSQPVHDDAAFRRCSKQYDENPPANNTYTASTSHSHQTPRKEISQGKISSLPRSHIPSRIPRSKENNKGTRAGNSMAIFFTRSRRTSPLPEPQLLIRELPPNSYSLFGPWKKLLKNSLALRVNYTLERRKVDNFNRDIVKGNIFA